MSWSNTYSHNLLYALDITGAVVFWNHSDITISAMCRVVQLADAHVTKSEWQPRLDSLKLWRWQIAVLRWLAPRLDGIQAHHCELARLADLQRAAGLIKLLDDPSLD